MLDINLIRKSPEIVRKALTDRNMNPKLLDDFLALDNEWRKLTKEIDESRAELNKLSKEYKITPEGGDPRPAKTVKEGIKSKEAEIKEVEAKREELLYQFPNISAPGVLMGKDETGNKISNPWGEKPKYFKEDYLTLAERLDLIDVKRAAKVSGSRFGYLKKQAALLEFALINFAFETLAKEGFIPVVPPVMIRPELYQGMGRLAGDQKEERYFLPSDNLYLAGSAEHTIGPMHAGEIFEERDLPRRYVAFSTCFRKEAGSYGKDTRGILRVHQFDKVEMFSYTTPEKSEAEHKFLLSLQEKMMQKLKLPYQVVEICTGDMGFTDAKQYDIEVWIPSENRYRETHSCSNTTDFQARGVNIKYRPLTPNPQTLNPQFVHMLNATGFAIGRTIIAILENFQTKKGTVKIPSALTKYTGFKEIRGNR